MTWRVSMHGKAVGFRFHEGAERGMLLAGEAVLAESDRHVPIEEGTLSRSGDVSQEGLTVAVSYDTPYAVRQHENMSYHHDGGRTAKYLENAFNKKADEVMEIIARSIRGAI